MVVVEGVKAGTTLTGLVLDEDRTITLPCVQDIPIGHKVALKDMAVGDTVIKYGIDIGKVVQPIAKGSTPTSTTSRPRGGEHGTEADILGLSPREQPRGRAATT